MTAIDDQPESTGCAVAMGTAGRQISLVELISVTVRISLVTGHPVNNERL